MARPTSDRVTVRFVAKYRVRPWVASFYEWNPKTKKREQREPSFATEEAARTFAADKEAELRQVTVYLAKLARNPIVPLAGGFTYREYFEERFLKNHLPRKKAATYETYVSIVRLHVLPIAGEVPVTPDTFTSETVEAIVAAARDKGLTWGQQQNVIKTLGATLRWLCPPLGKVLPVNPVRGLLRALADENWTEPEPNPLTYDQQCALLTWIETGVLPDDYVPLQPPGDMPVDRLTDREAKRRRWPNVRGGFAQWFAFFLLLLHTGMRRGEAMALRWDAVFLEDQHGKPLKEPYLEVRRGHSLAAARLARSGHEQYAADGLVTPKTKHERRVWLSPELADVLRERARTRRERGKWGEPSPFVFPHPTVPTRPVGADTVAKVLAAALHAIGAGDVGFTVHSLRDTFATVNLLRGTPVLWVAAMLGHKRRSMTLDRYAKWIPQESSAGYVSVMERPKLQPAAAEAGGKLHQENADPGAVSGARPAPTTKGVGRSGESWGLREVPKPRRR